MTTNQEYSYVRKIKRAGLIGLMLMIAGCVQSGNHQAATMDTSRMGVSHDVEPCHFKPARSVHCGRTPTAAFDHDGKLWVSYVIDRNVYVAWSDDQGSHYSDPVRVNDVSEEIYTNGENRPKIAFGRNREIYVSWTAVRDGLFAGDIRFTRSLDGGRHFEAVRTVNDDGLLTSHRFETLFVSDSGDVYLAWLDKRDLVAAQKRSEKYEGAAIYYTMSTDNGKNFTKNLKVVDYSCECCRIAMSETPQGDVAMFWRQIYDSQIRDHGFAVIGKSAVVLAAQRATIDDWHIDACPHHGPSMATASNGNYHLTWFTLGDTRKGIFYGRYRPDTKGLDDIVTVATTGASHPYIARLNNTLFLVWKQFDGENTTIRLSMSEDEGGSWQPSLVVASTREASDHPLLQVHDNKVYLNWHTGDEGLRVLALNQ